MFPTFKKLYNDFSSDENFKSKLNGLYILIFLHGMIFYSLFEFSNFLSRIYAIIAITLFLITPLILLGYLTKFSYNIINNKKPYLPAWKKKLKIHFIVGLKTGFLLVTFWLLLILINLKMNLNEHFNPYNFPYKNITIYLALYLVIYLIIIWNSVSFLINSKDLKLIQSLNPIKVLLKSIKFLKKFWKESILFFTGIYLLQKASIVITDALVDKILIPICEYTIYVYKKITPILPTYIHTKTKILLIILLKLYCSFLIILPFVILIVGLFILLYYFAQAFKELESNLES